MGRDRLGEGRKKRQGVGEGVDSEENRRRTRRYGVKTKDGGVNGRIRKVGARLEMDQRVRRGKVMTGDGRRWTGELGERWTRSD